MPQRATLSVKAGPTPLPVVPTACAPRIASSAWSMIECQGIIRCARSETRSRSVLTPRVSSFVISSISTAGSITTPLPMIDVLSA